jgi:polyphosphate kinase
MGKKTLKVLWRDLAWLSFNERVMQEAKDNTNHPFDRLRFLGIFSNNQDEFFRVRVATLNRMVSLGKAAKKQLEEDPELVLKAIQERAVVQQLVFDRACSQVIRDLKRKNIFIKNEKQLNERQSRFVRRYFEEKVRTQIVPLMIESIQDMPLLHDKSIYLACVLARNACPAMRRFSLIEIPAGSLPRFVSLPSGKNTRDIILLEDIIRLNLPQIFSAMNFDRHEGYIVKVTRDAELDLDNDINANIIEALENGIKNRKKGKTTRFVYDRNIDPHLLDYLVKRLHLTKRDNLIAGGRIHNFKDFMNFPSKVFKDWHLRPSPFIHPELVQPCRIMDVLDRKDIMLHFPYHSFDSLIDLLREAAIDPFVQSISITCYRLAKDSKIINALINAARNGKKVTAVIELRARFEEKANLAWKTLLEEEGAKVILGRPDMKVHAKLCVIEKVVNNKRKGYGFVSTGNFNENTARYYGDHCLLTSKRKIISDIRRIFNHLEFPNRKSASLRHCKSLPVSPYNMRGYFMKCMDEEIHAARNKKHAEIKIKLNNLVDRQLIEKIYEAAQEGVKVNLIIRGICCAITHHPSFKMPIRGISIIDEYLEHARVCIFHNQGLPKVFISSADWMARNMDYRVEAACPVFDKKLKQELIDIFDIQLSENVKARILNNSYKNIYVKRPDHEAQIRSQVAIRQYLLPKKTS